VHPSPAPLPQYAAKAGLDVARYNALVEARERVDDELRRL